MLDTAALHDGIEIGQISDFMDRDTISVVNFGKGTTLSGFQTISDAISYKEMSLKGSDWRIRDRLNPGSRISAILSVASMVRDHIRPTLDVLRDAGKPINTRFSAEICMFACAFIAEQKYPSTSRSPHGKRHQA